MVAGGRKTGEELLLLGPSVAHLALMFIAELVEF